MERQLLFNQITPDELVGVIFKGVKRLLDDKFDSVLQTNNTEELLTPKETCNYLKIDSVTLWRWQNENLLIPYGIKGKRYYKKSEILNSLQRLSNDSAVSIA